ncbi:MULTISPECIES: GNAT family N-acetyltransferase [Arenibacter]|uniref:GNAT family N-acetyltransferase n=1 Tax=Arenibacter TaxID=178469 RepID=UPI0004DFA7E2|nr:MULTISPECIES: GNAT family N-acetyltransferase [Arenibacter]GBF21245.1 aminoalkylphosphonic acid N-acetyltransferase [Arenibacter sp. NBRC 103722]|tara:strand:+ start:1669 stop:2148 length:480 start_codon:yes stop_codon:yes gene_type:complete
MKYIIRDAEAKDMAQVHKLIQELAVFEKEDNAVEVTVEDLKTDGFGTDKLFHCYVAETDGDVVGMALLYSRYSTWKGPIIHLEDLIVTEAMRGSGLGAALLAKVVEHGYQLGVKRISWEVLDWNDPAISFYESKGARVLRDWNVVHLDEKGIKTFLNKL